jgi:hypothetical protein
MKCRQKAFKFAASIPRLPGPSQTYQHVCSDIHWLQPRGIKPIAYRGQKRKEMKVSQTPP